MSKSTPREETTDTPYVGQALTRREDRRHLIGRGRFTDDITPPDTLYAAIVRSPHAHARILAIDVEEARRLPGVVAVYTGADLRDQLEPLPCNWVLPGMRVPTHRALAIDTVRFHGDGVAVVVAEDPYIARDALDAVRVTYEPLPAATSPTQAAASNAPKVHGDMPSNVAFTFPVRGGDYAHASKQAEVRVRQQLLNQNMIPSALEPRAVVAEYDIGTDQLTVHSATQSPHIIKRMLAGVLRFPEHQIRVVAPDVGGGFGAKLHLYPEEVLCAFLARELTRPVKWTATRSEDFLATNHGRDHVQEIEVIAQHDGTITGIKATLYANLGAYLSGMGPGVPAVNCGFMLTGVYRIRNVDVQVHGVFTHTSRVDTYRGAGRPEATYLIERAVDLLARELKLDPAEVRRKNFIPPDAFPYKLPMRGFEYDSGNYEPNLNKALALADYHALRKRQAALRREGRYLGIGITTYTEFTGIGPGAALNMIGFQYGGWEYARVLAHATGKVSVFSGAADHGQGHGTSFAQIAADALGIPVEHIEVVQGDTARVPFGNGTFNSRSMPVGGTAIKLCCDRVIDKARRIAAHTLSVRPQDLDYTQGIFQVRERLNPVRVVTRAAERTRRQAVGAVVQAASGFVIPNEGAGRDSISFEEVARLAHFVSTYPPDLEPGLDEQMFYEPKNMTFPFGSYVAVVEVDVETGDIAWERLVAVDDCGPLINPLLARGQVHGGVAQGVGQALLEGAVYAEDGALASANWMTYAFPRAAHLPHIETDHTVTPTPLNPLGVKGLGEAATIATPPAVVNAVVDALAPFGVTHIDMPLSAENVWLAIQHATNGGKQ
jgi:carbon-monoxide dehydrogenase large subunit